MEGNSGGTTLKQFGKGSATIAVNKPSRGRTSFEHGQHCKDKVTYVKYVYRRRAKNSEIQLWRQGLCRLPDFQSSDRSALSKLAVAVGLNRPVKDHRSDTGYYNAFYPVWIIIKRPANDFLVNF